MSRVRSVLEPSTVEQCARRFIMQLLLETDEGFWLRRAREFACVGTASCDEIATACRHKAALCRESGGAEWAEMLAIELGEAA